MNRRKFLRSSFLSLAAVPVISRSGLGRAFPSPDDSIEFKGQNVLARIIEKATSLGWHDRPIGDLTGLVGLELRGTPYVAGTLELYTDREVCSANLLGLDCVTFYEAALGIARMIKTGQGSPEDLLGQFALMRYRGGEPGDYASRLHYTSEWFADNAAKGIVDVITKNLKGAEKYTKRIDFMSTHTSAYKQLDGNPGMVTEIEAAEQRLNQATRYYVPKAKVQQAEPELQTGDILGITTSIKGLDVSHTGLCYRDEKGTLRLLHASLTQKKVVLDTALHSYLADNKKQTGIIVARPLSTI